MKNILYLIVGFLAISGCTKDDGVPSTIDIKSTFDNTQFSGYFILDGVSVPLDGAFVHVTRNSTFNEIIVNLAPAGVSGSVAFPGSGWVQFRFHTDVKSGFVTASKLENNFTVSSTKATNPAIFEGVYIGTDNNYEIQQYGEVLNNQMEYTSAEEYSFDFSFQSDTFWQADLGSNTIENKNGDIFFSISTSSSGTAAGGTNPLIGTWAYQQANCGSNKSLIKFFNDTKGEIMIPDCDNIGSCPTGSVTGFDYTTSGGNITFDYTSFTVCGQTATPPQGGTIGYSVSGNTLTLGSQTWTRQ